MRFRARASAVSAAAAANGKGPRPPNRRKALVAAPEEMAVAPFTFAVTAVCRVLRRRSGLWFAWLRAALPRSATSAGWRAARSPTALRLEAEPPVLLAGGAGRAAGRMRGGASRCQGTRVRRLSRRRPSCVIRDVRTGAARDGVDDGGDGGGHRVRRLSRTRRGPKTDKRLHAPTSSQ